MPELTEQPASRDAAGRWPLAAGRWLGAQLGATYQGRAENIAGVSTGWQRLTRRSAQPRGDTRSGARDAGFAAPAAGLRSCAALGPLAHGAGVRNFVDPSGVRRCSGPLQRNKVWGYRSRHEACATDHHGVQKNTATASASGVRSGWISGGSQPFGVVLEGAGLPASAGSQIKRAKSGESNRRVTAGQAKLGGGDSPGG